MNVLQDRPTILQYCNSGTAGPSSRLVVENVKTATQAHIEREMRECIIRLKHDTLRECLRKATWFVVVVVLLLCVLHYCIRYAALPRPLFLEFRELPPPCY